MSTIPLSKQLQIESYWIENQIINFNFWIEYSISIVDLNSSIIDIRNRVQEKLKTSISTQKLKNQYHSKSILTPIENDF